MRFFLTMLLVALFLMVNDVSGEQPAKHAQSPVTQSEQTLEEPDLADLVPEATDLSHRLVLLEKQIADALSMSAVEQRYAEIMASLDDQAGMLQSLKDEKDYQYRDLIEFKTNILRNAASLQKLSDPLARAIRDMEYSRKAWLAERGKWSEWEVSLSKGEPLDEVRSVFKQAQKTIDTAQGLVLKQLKPLLAAQQKAGEIKARIDALAAEAEDLITAMKSSVLIGSSPPMLSSSYFSQFGSELWYEFTKGLSRVRWPKSGFFERQGWVFFLQVLFSLFLVIAIFRHRKKLKASENWSFVGKRPISSGLFVGLMSLLPFYEAVPATWVLAVTTVIGVSFARVLGGLLKLTWKRQAVYGLVTFLIATRLFQSVGLPLPLFRLYLLTAALVGFFLCMWWSAAAHRHGDPLLYRWGSRLGSVFFAVVVMLQLWGKKAGLTEYLFESSVMTVLFVLTGWLMRHLVHGGLEWVFQIAPVKRVAFLESRTAGMIRRSKRFVDVLVGFLILSFLLTLWRVYDSPVAAAKGLVSFGFTLGSQQISVGLLIVAAGFVYGSFLVSWVIQSLFLEELAAKRGMETGVKISISRLVHYVLVSVGFILALVALGLELTEVTIILGALGVGIGFGLQGIVNNFICGLILLFERPVRVGDYLEVGGAWVTVKKIGLRSTIVQSFDRADIIIPNADLVTNQVINWTLTDRSARLIVPVGVAYGSDVSLVIDTLMQCATEHPKVSVMYRPQVLFMSFGESSLDFELRVWVTDADERLSVRSELHREIDKKFREAGIEIPFPQRDLHIRRVPEDAAPKLKEEPSFLSEGALIPNKQDE